MSSSFYVIRKTNVQKTNLRPKLMGTHAKHVIFEGNNVEEGVERYRSRGHICKYRLKWDLGIKNTKNPQSATVKSSNLITIRKYAKAPERDFTTRI